MIMDRISGATLCEARYLENLVGHFQAEAQTFPMANYRAGMLKLFDVIFYISYEKKILFS